MLAHDLAQALLKGPNKPVEVCIPADNQYGEDKEPANKDDLYADAQSVSAKGDVVIITGG